MSEHDALREILARHRAEHAARGPHDAAYAPFAHPAPRGFVARLARDAGALPAVIAEVKRRSPSGGAFAHDDVVAVARAYERAGASALSVLTDGPAFGGSLDDVRAVRAAVSVPVLRKDFLVGPGEVFEAARAGADAVLLIAEALDDATLAALLAEARAAGVDALVEAHTAREAERVVALGATALGVNNRDLASLRTDPGTALRVLPTFAGRVALRVAESGLRTVDDLRAARASGADAVLVGEALLRASDPGAALRALRGEPAP